MYHFFYLTRIERVCLVTRHKSIHSQIDKGQVDEQQSTSNLPAASWRPLIDNLGYSVGFFIVILGRQQLFTENTLTAMLPLFAHPKKHQAAHHHPHHLHRCAGRFRAYHRRFRRCAVPGKYWSCFLGRLLAGFHAADTDRQHHRRRIARSRAQFRPGSCRDCQKWVDISIQERW